MMHGDARRSTFRRGVHMSKHSYLEQCIDLLEERRLLSAAIVGGVLKVTGSAGGDEISLKKTTAGSVLSVNGRQQTFSARAVHTIRVDGGRGNDSIKDAVNLAATLLGGGGNDNIIGGAGKNSI